MGLVKVTKFASEPSIVGCELALAEAGVAGPRRDRTGCRLGTGLNHLFFRIVWSQSQLDQRPGIGGDFGLPAVDALIAGHSFLSAGVPFAAGFAAQVVLADQGFLDFPRTFRLDDLLAVPLPGA